MTSGLGRDGRQGSFLGELVYQWGEDDVMRCRENRKAWTEEGAWGVGRRSWQGPGQLFPRIWTLFQGSGALWKFLEGRRMESDVCFGKFAHLLGRLDKGMPGGWRLLRKSR